MLTHAANNKTFTHMTVANLDRLAREEYLVDLAAGTVLEKSVQLMGIVLGVSPIEAMVKLEMEPGRRRC